MFAQVSKADSFGGGASHVASMLHHRFKEEALDSHHIVSWSGSGFNHGMVSLYGNHRKLIRKLHSAQKKLLAPELLPFEVITFYRHYQRKRYKMINFHDLSSAISPLSVYLATKFTNVVWTIHDCSAFTAGCLYPMDCKNYIRCACMRCPRKGEWPIDTASPLLPLSLLVKKMVHRSNIQLVTPSHWMKDMIVGSAVIPKKAVKVIPNGVDHRIYNTVLEGNSPNRKYLDDRINILVSSGNLDDERKGINFSIESIRALDKRKIRILATGNGFERISAFLDGYDVVNFGYVSDERKMANIYRVADVFLFCSLADNHPLAVLESVSCGTPVYGFDTGGVGEIISEPALGCLTKQKDVQLLVDRLNNLLNVFNTEGRQSIKITQVNDRFSLENMYEHYKSLYTCMIST